MLRQKNHRRSRYTLAGLLLGCVLFGAQPQNSLSQNLFDFSPIEKLLRDSVKKFDGGCSILLIQDGKVLYEKSFGAYPLDTALPIASASKWLSAALIMSLCDSGWLSLNDSVRKYLPYFVGEKSCITLKQLLNHTSGFPGEIPAMRDLTLTLKQSSQKIGGTTLSYKPGAAFLYGGASMQMAGRIVEIAGGQKAWQQLFDERIAKPLGLSHTHFYAFGKTDNPLIAGGAMSSAREYARFLQMLVNKGVWNGRRILSEQAVTEMHREQTGSVSILHIVDNQLKPQQPAEKSNYGIGVWRITSSTSGELIEINSQGRFGFSPWIDIRRNVIGVLSTRTPLKNIMPTYKRLKQLIREIIPAISTTASMAK